MRLPERWRRRFFRTWPVAAAALAGLLLLIYTSVAATSKRAEEIYTELDQRNSHHREVEGKLRRLRSDVHLSSIYIRDYLLDTDREEAPEYRHKLEELRRSHAATVKELRVLLPRDAAPQVDKLEKGIDAYWRAFDPLFEWTLYEKLMRSGRFLRKEVLPRREAVLTITRDIEELNNANLAAQRSGAARRLAQFRDDLERRLGRTLLLGFVVAVLAVLRLRAVEHRSERQRLHAEAAENEMRHLSQQLVAAQEEERKKLTRELHDHVGQMLTALRLEIGRADRARGRSDAQLGQALGEARRVLDTIVRSVRDLVMGLRPSMLDDFGLQPALEWHVRDFRRRTGMAATVSMQGDLDALPDHHRTAIYRIVQEALTNCARHSGASRVSVDVAFHDSAIELAIRDDGCGIDPRRPRGMGLLGIEERVRELDGSFDVVAQQPSGTALRVMLPVVRPEEEDTLARIAG